MDSHTQFFYQIKTLIKLVVFILISIQGVCGRPPGLVVRKHIEICLAGKSGAYFYAKEGQVCCSCDAGEHLMEDCIQNEPNSTNCALCVHNGTLNIFTFTSKANSYPACNISISESDCENLMLTEFQMGNSTTNGRCTCVNGSFAKNPEITGCTLFQECPKGFEPTFYGNSTDNVKCGRCLPGMCSYTSSSTEKCVPCADDVTDLDDDFTTLAPAATNSVNAEFPVGIIVAIVIGAVVLIVVITIVLLWKCRSWPFQRRNEKNQVPNSTELHDMNDNPPHSHHNGRETYRGDAKDSSETEEFIPKSETNGQSNGRSNGSKFFVGEDDGGPKGLIRESPQPPVEQPPVSTQSVDQQEQPRTPVVRNGPSPVPNTSRDGTKENQGVIRESPQPPVERPPVSTEPVNPQEQPLTPVARNGPSPVPNTQNQDESDGEPDAHLPTSPHQSLSNSEPQDNKSPPASTAGSGTDAQELSDIERQLQEDLKVFNTEEQNTLREMNMPQALHKALYSQDCLDKMCRMWFLNIGQNDLREFLRRYSLLRDNRIDEIPNEKGSKSSDITYQYLHEMRQEQGERIYPRVLFEKILDFNKLQFYDDLFKYFVEILKGNNPNQNNS